MARICNNCGRVQCSCKRLSEESQRVYILVTEKTTSIVKGSSNIELPASICSDVVQKILRYYDGADIKREEINGIIWYTVKI